jgi:hypothetical protein
MFNGGFKEASSNLVTFLDNTSDSFDLLLGWVYYSTLRELSLVEDDTQTTIPS